MISITKFRTCPLCLRYDIEQEDSDLSLRVQKYLEILPESLVKNDEELVREVLIWLARNNALSLSNL